MNVKPCLKLIEQPQLYVGCGGTVCQVFAQLVLFLTLRETVILPVWFVLAVCKCTNVQHQ